MNFLKIRRPQEFFFQLALLIALVTFGTTSLIYMLEAKRLVGMVLLMGLAIPLAAILSGNPRLFFLIGLILTIPFDLSKTFRAFPHFGGEWALRIEAPDPFLIVLCLFWLKDLLSGHVKFIRLPAISILWFLMMLLGMCSYFYSSYRTMMVYEVIRMGKMLLLLLFISNQVHRYKQIKVIVWAIIASAALQIVYGYMQYFGISLGLERMGEAGESITEAFGFMTASRVGALMGHPNMFASYLVMILPLSYALFFSRSDYFSKSLFVSVLVLGSGTLILTLSRGGWIGFACAITATAFVSFFHPSVSRRAAVMQVFIFLAVVAAGLVLSGPIIQKFTMSAQSSVLSRWDLMYIAWDMMLSNPWLGVGLNASTYVLPQYDFTGYVWGEQNPPVHNIYLLYGAEQGFIGLALWIILCILVVRVGIKNLKSKDDFLVSVNIGILMGLCGVLLQGMVDWTLRVNVVQRIFFLLIAVLVAIENYQSTNAQNMEKETLTDKTLKSAVE